MIYYYLISSSDNFSARVPCGTQRTGNHPLQSSSIRPGGRTNQWRTYFMNVEKRRNFIIQFAYLFIIGLIAYFWRLEHSYEYISRRNREIPHKVQGNNACFPAAFRPP